MLKSSSLLLAFLLLAPVENCPKPPVPGPTPTPTVTPTPELPPTPVGCTLTVPWCNEISQKCSTVESPCKHNPTSDPNHCELAPNCSVPPVEPPVEPPPPSADVCTIPLNGVRVLSAYFLFDRVVDFTPKITNPTRCSLPEVGYFGRQTCPVCNEGCAQRGICEEVLMGGIPPEFNCTSETLKCYRQDNWGVKVVGDGTGTLRACYPNKEACVTLNITCTGKKCTSIN